MEHLADAVAAIFANYGEAALFSMFLYDFADITQCCAVADDFDAFIQAFLSDFRQALGPLRTLPT